MSTVGVGKIRPFTKRARLPQAQKEPSIGSCQLYTCRRPFEPRRTKGKKQVFCSITCRVKFFQEARIIGAALLKRAVRDSKARDWIIALKEVR